MGTTAKTTYAVGSQARSCQGTGVRIDIGLGDGPDRANGAGDLLDPAPPGAGLQSGP